MRRARCYRKLPTLLGAVVLAGCSTATPVTSSRGTSAPRRTSLVLPSPALLDGYGALAGGAEFYRNDHRLGRDPATRAPKESYAEIEVRERLWVTNGRPREHTVIRSRSVTRRRGR